ncbi:MAG: DNA replication/repair protein RecF [bacterium]|nr:DNA replication/repair protein RecF [bacterium]
MIIRKLLLSNYRNYKNLELSLSPGINVINGDNAQGKTNLLEAIYYLGTLKSFRVRSEAELIFWEQEWASITADFVRPSGENCQLEVRWAHNLKGKWERRVKRNGAGLNSLADFLSEVPLALFIPQDLALVQGAPDGRRRYLDILLCKSSARYLRTLVRYQQVLRQRNEWLRRYERRSHIQELDVWDEQLTVLAAYLVKEREKTVSQLGSVVNEVFNALANTEADLQLNYRASLLGEADEMLEALRNKREDELIRRLTLLGPHRDDIIIKMKGRSLKQCASQGQQRSAALAMRLAEAILMGRINENPAIVLLDDCFSELDQKRCHRLFDYLDTLGQVILTSANRLEYKGRASVKEYIVNEGTILAI